MSRYLFIINQYAQPEQFSSGIKPDDSVKLVSTHSLFENEQKEWQAKLGCDIKFFRFDHWNHLLEQAELDRKTFDRCRSLIPYTSIYQSAYFKEIARAKNAFIHQQLIQEGHIDKSTAIRVGCGPYELYNLGISRAYWKKKGATILNIHSPEAGAMTYKRFTALKPFKWTLYILKAFVLSVLPRKVELVKDGDHRFALFSTRRIKLKADLETRTSYLIPLLWQFSTYKLAAPIHSNESLLAMYPFVRRGNMAVIQDAFRPTSYPPYYYANSYDGCHMVAQDRVDERFFNDAGLSVYPIGTLLAKKELQGSSDTDKIALRTLCLSLNHAGNWSSLISRCDTDGLIQAMIPLVEAKPELHFIIRLHPNSSKPMAEGTGWHQRIRTQLDQLEHANLEVSDRSIEEDWQRADLFISEYSLSVVDALQFGKLVCFLNLTRRRSFVKDLVDVGFPEVHSVEELAQTITAYQREPEVARKELAASVQRYNERYAGR